MGKLGFIKKLRCIDIVDLVWSIWFQSQNQELDQLATGLGTEPSPVGIAQNRSIQSGLGGSCCTPLASKGCLANPCWLWVRASPPSLALGEGGMVREPLPKRINRDSIKFYMRVEFLCSLFGFSIINVQASTQQC